jgi:hypothetical protein
MGIFRNREAGDIVFSIANVARRSWRVPVIVAVLVACAAAGKQADCGGKSNGCGPCVGAIPGNVARVRGVAAANCWLEERYQARKCRSPAGGFACQDWSSE